MRRDNRARKLPQSLMIRVSRRRVLQLGVALGGVPTAILLEAACQPAAAPTGAPATEAPAATQAPATTQASPTATPSQAVVYASQLDPNKVYSALPPYQEEGLRPPPPSFDNVEWSVLIEQLTRSLQAILKERLLGDLGAEIASSMEVSQIDIYDPEVYKDKPPVPPATPLGDVARTLNEELQFKLINDYGVPEEEAQFAVVGELNLILGYSFGQAASLLAVGVARANPTHCGSAGSCTFHNVTKNRWCVRCCSLC